jgi:hypothetical protein
MTPQQQASEAVEKEVGFRKTIRQWEEISGVCILDPDGFDRTDPKLYEREFTWKEFSKGLPFCTLKGANSVVDADKRYIAWLELLLRQAVSFAVNQRRTTNEDQEKNRPAFL